MISFDPQNPFPLLPMGSYTYAEAKEHAIQTDQWLQFDIKATEEKLAHWNQKNSDFPQETWVGLDPQSFLTPYVEIRSILNLLQLSSGNQVIDLGCGYARMAHVIGRHYPEISFQGYELVLERVIESQKRLKPFNYPNVSVSNKDLARSSPVSASCYFIYDYGSKQAIEKTLQDLQTISKEKSIQVVARGRASRNFILQGHAWLSEVNEPQHFETFSIFRS